jgi:hypothetical protein
VNFVGQRDRRLDNHTLVTPSSIDQLHASVLIVAAPASTSAANVRCSAMIAGSLSQGARRSADANTDASTRPWSTPLMRSRLPQVRAACANPVNFNKLLAFADIQ